MEKNDGIMLVMELVRAKVVEDNCAEGRNDLLAESKSLGGLPLAGAFVMIPKHWLDAVCPHVRAEIPNAGVTLPDGTEVVTEFPIELDSQWQSWLGIQASRVSEANLVFARRATNGFPPENLTISDNTNWDLAKQIENVFSMLR